MIRITKQKKFSAFLLISLLISNSFISNYNAFAYNSFYSNNDIFFYEPDDNNCPDDTTSTSIPASSSGFDRLKDAVKTYGETAMNLQREYGVPWEAVLAQMQKESQVGTEGYAVQGADNNWLGLGGTGDAGFYRSGSGRKWAKYTSVEASMMAWAGPPFLRNGRYDDAFKYLDPNNYDLDAFLTSMIYVYAPPSENATDLYIQQVSGFIKGPIAEARLELGWPSSAELAKNENIAIGGKHPIGSNMQSTETTSISSNDCVGTKGMDESEAIQYMNTYENSDGNALYNPWVCGGYTSSEDPTGSKNKLANCVAVVSYFIQNNTNLGPIDLVDGGQVVSKLIQSGFTDGGNTPKPYAVFSTSKYTRSTSGHTGLVLGVKGDSVIIFEEGCGHKLHKDGDPWTGINIYPMSEATSEYTYAYPPNGSLVGLK